MSASDLAPLWELRDITKQYAGVTANDRVNLKLLPGQIHGLLGENGCGKSTLIKILSGVEQPTAGTIYKDGVPFIVHTPVAARAAGIATVYQEFSLVPDLTVAENIFLGRPLRRPNTGFVAWRRMNDEAWKTLQVLGIESEIDPAMSIRELSVAQQQLVEIAKAVSADARTLILDEPTAALGSSEIARLHTLLRRLRGLGHAILYVSHRLDEVIDLIDVATILKDGQRVRAPGEVEISLRPIVAAMIGADIAEHYPGRSGTIGRVLLEGAKISTDNGVVDASLDVHRGEILGICGVMGSGRTALLRALFGLDSLRSGAMRLDGEDYAPRTPAEAIARGVGFIPENRKSDGLFFNMAGPANTTIAALGRITRHHLLDFETERSVFDELTRDLTISLRARENTIGSLSGGNQQKVVLARWMFADADLLLLDEPTQGIDVGAKAAIYRLIRDLTRRGKAIVLVSSDTAELLALSDRIGVLRNGVLSELGPASAFDEHALSVGAVGGLVAPIQKSLSSAVAPS